MKLAAMDLVLRPSDDADAFARARALGLDGVEFNIHIADLQDPQSDRPRRLRAMAADSGVEIPSLVLGEHNSGGIATWWRDQTADDEIRIALECCAAVGAETLLVPFFFFNEPKGRTHRAAVAERLKPLCSHAASLNIVLAFEGVLAAAQLQEMAGAIDSPAFAVYFDPANITWCDLDAPAELRALGPLVRQIHIKEARVFTGDAPAGQGRVDWPGIVAAINAIGYDRWLVLETPAGPVESVARDVAFSRNTFSRLTAHA